MALITLLIITFLLFLLVRIMPGNPFPAERMSAAAIAKKRAEMGLDNPMLVQFWNYIKNIRSSCSNVQFFQDRRDLHLLWRDRRTDPGNCGSFEQR